jgi:plasmid stability protein
MLAPVAKRKGTQDPPDGSVLYVRDMPRDVLARMKAAAALNHKSLAEYVRDLFETHVADLEKKGVLPKGKG